MERKPSSFTSLKFVTTLSSLLNHFAPKTELCASSDWLISAFFSIPTSIIITAHTVHYSSEVLDWIASTCSNKLCLLQNSASLDWVKVCFFGILFIVFITESNLTSVFYYMWGSTIRILTQTLTCNTKVSCCGLSPLSANTLFMSQNKGW